MVENSLNMDTEALEEQEYDLDLEKFTSRVVETYRSEADINNFSSEQGRSKRIANGLQEEDNNDCKNAQE